MMYQICWTRPDLLTNNTSKLNLNVHFLSDFSCSNIHTKPNHLFANQLTKTMITSNLTQIDSLVTVFTKKGFETRLLALALRWTAKFEKVPNSTINAQISVENI